MTVALPLRLLCVPLCLIVASCGYALDSSHQDVQFVTIGAEGAQCFADANGVKYQVFPPQTLNIKKSRVDMNVSCVAPGNRKVETVVPAILSTKAVWGGPALAFDYAASSSHHYPAVVAIDFSQVEVKPNAAPDYNHDDLRQPEDYNLEEFAPSSPRLNADRHKVDMPLIRRGTDQAWDDAYDAPLVSTEKGDLVPVSTPVPMPSPSDAVSSDEPTSLYPGQ